MQLHDLMAKLFELRQVAADQAKDGPSGSGAMARALTAYEWLGDNIEAFVAGLDPEMTEGPASQTEGMGGDAGLVDRLREVYGQITPGAIERADLDGMAFTVKDAIAALTPPETAEAVPVAAEEGVVSVNEYAASYYFATDDGDYSPVEGERAMIEDAINGYLASHPAPEVARLREELAEANERADANAHGGFVWMERAEAAESKLADAVKALETAREALKPFSDYADPLRTAYPDDMPMTKGSAIAARQVTAGDFRRARAAYHAAARSASSQGGE